MMDKQWIVVRSKPRSAKVANNELVKKNIESYLPLLKERRKWSDRKKWVEFPLFSSYLFARIDIKDSIFVLQTQGVNTIVKFGKQIAIVQNSVIEAIRLAMEGGYKLEPVEYFVEGNRVEVVAGPMKGIKGIVAKLRGQNRLIIKIDAIQQALSIQIESKFIRNLNSKTAPIL